MIRTAIAGAALLAACATAPEERIDFSGVQDDLAGEPTKVLVLGTVHINQQPAEAFDLANLSLVLEKLEAFEPDIIAIENVDGEDCFVMRAFGNVYPGVADRYCPDPQPALASLGMTQPEATMALWTLLDEVGDDPAPAQRRRLAALFWATGNPYSSVVQWYGLDEAERRTGDGIDESLLELIEKRSQSRNESNAIAAVLADRAGLQQVHPMDDHTADRVIIRSKTNPYKILGEEVWGKYAPAGRAFYEETLKLIGTQEGVVEAYRRLNSLEAQKMTIAGDFGAAAAHSEETRTYVAWWQARGLRMAANVVEAAGTEPGARVLVIVGASHKAYFDAYLDQMQDMEILSVDDVLAD
ncbi:hypothetical protein HK107_05990 [Parvularcula sp. ZS-1/3]|uniref:Uncharacterized protein n=1 Tax=Parvularcula mediterranea TaxID=2732508 RepID=A0A7Y3RKS5_9PROT|nr:DUF5694 domain-containing protein [Parvularcula mediterranea]NNU15871.1 hypothetical protein [Parvularcula mediterranea]